MNSLFDFDAEAPRYPETPGHRGVETSIDAANSIAPKRKTIADMVLRAIRAAGPNGLTADECCAALGLDRWTVQPRTSELRAARLIGDGGKRRKNKTGKSAIVWLAAENLAAAETAQAA